MIYFDATYLAKFYVAEPDSAQIRARVMSEGKVASSLHARLEVAAVFHRKLREGTIAPDECRRLHEQFAIDCEDDLWIWFPLRGELIELASAKYRALSSAIFLRAADALHLTCAAENGFTQVFSNDRHLLAAAPHFGLTGVTL
jgi:uncharacterized protein